MNDSFDKVIPSVCFIFADIILHVDPFEEDTTITIRQVVILTQMLTLCN